MTTVTPENQVTAEPADKDVRAIAATYATGAAIFSLAPPLVHHGIDIAETQAWLDSWDGPIEIEPRDLHITIGGDSAFCHGYMRVTGKKKGVEQPISFWMRETLCLHGAKTRRRSYTNTRRSRSIWIAACDQRSTSSLNDSETETRKEQQTMKLYTQLNFGGNCEEAFRFYEQHLGGKITLLMKHRDAPTSSKASPDWQENAILHAHMTIGETDLVANDVPPQIFKPIRSSYLVLSVDTSEEAERIYGVLAAGGEVYMALEETFFAFRFSMLRDKFGTLWTILNPRPMDRSDQPR